MSDQGPDIADPVPDHRGSFKADTPPVDVDVLGESHRFQHFWPEHSAISDLDPFLELRVESKDLERGFRVWVVGGFEPEVFDPHLLEEDSHEAYKHELVLGEQVNHLSRPTDKIRECQVPIGDDSLNLMELCQMRCVHRLVPEHPVDTKQLGRLEPILFLRPRHFARNHAFCLLVKFLPSTLGREFPQHRC